MTPTPDERFLSTVDHALRIHDRIVALQDALQDSLSAASHQASYASREAVTEAYSALQAVKVPGRGPIGLVAKGRRLLNPGDSIRITRGDVRPKLSAGAAAVYVMLSADLEVVYVGMTTNPPTRLIGRGEIPWVYADIYCCQDLDVLPSTRTEPATTSASGHSPAVFDAKHRGVLIAFPSRLGDMSWEPWIEYAQFRIKEAFRLLPDWDHAGAEPVSVEAAFLANAIAQQLNEARLSRPFITPTIEGAIAFEWSGGEADVFLTVYEADVDVAVRDPADGRFHEGRLSEMGDYLGRALARLTR